MFWLPQRHVANELKAFHHPVQIAAFGHSRVELSFVQAKSGQIVGIFRHDWQHVFKLRMNTLSLVFIHSSNFIAQTFIESAIANYLK